VPDHNALLYVLVLYNTKLEDSLTFKTLVNAQDFNHEKLTIFVYDNSPAYNQNIDAGYNNERYEIIYYPDVANSGVSKAYNTGFEFACSKGFKWLLLLDQDTSLPLNFVQRYNKAISVADQQYIIVPIIRSNLNQKILSPFKVWLKRGHVIKKIDTGISAMNDLCVINCGMCIPVEIFKKAGKYDEALKLDFTDMEFISRVKKVGHKRFEVLDLDLEHDLSAMSKGSLVSDLTRYGIYMTSVMHLVQKERSSSILFYYLNSMIRCIKLSMLHRSQKFIFEWFKFVF
jgi:rhamnosyltransferase